MDEKSLLKALLRSMQLELGHRGYLMPPHIIPGNGCTLIKKSGDDKSAIYVTMILENGEFKVFHELQIDRWRHGTRQDTVAEETFSIADPEMMDDVWKVLDVLEERLDCLNAKT